MNHKTKAYKLAQAKRVWLEWGHLLQGYSLVNGEVVVSE
jgi:hypothetical protein